MAMNEEREIKESDLDDRTYALHLRGWLRVRDGVLEFDERPINEALLDAMQKQGVLHLAHNNEALIEIKKTTMSLDAFNALIATRNIDPSTYLGQEAEDLDMVISAKALARLFLLRDALFGAPESAQEQLGASQFLHTLDALGALDAHKIEDLLGDA